MSLRLATLSLVPRQSMLGATRAMPMLARAMPLMARGYSTQEPKARANAIIDSLPGNNFISKTGILATGTAAAVYAVSNSLYVVNAETCLLTVFGVFLIVMSKTVAPAYKDWAEGHITTIKGALDKARGSHVVAVKDRIESVNQLKDVVATTKDLFALSKDTVELEAKAFELKQKVDLAAEAKSVLDSWVRYEGQVRQREQKELAESVVSKVEKELTSKKFQQQVLQQAVADVEAVFGKSA